MLVLWFAYSYTLKMDATYYYETSVDFQNYTALYPGRYIYFFALLLLVIICNMLKKLLDTPSYKEMRLLAQAMLIDFDVLGTQIGCSCNFIKCSTVVGVNRRLVSV